MTILFVLLANEVSLLLSNQNKERRRPISLHNGVLVEGEVKGSIDSWFPFVKTSVCFGMEVCMDKYIGKITTLGHNFKPIQGGTR